MASLRFDHVSSDEVHVLLDDGGDTDMAVSLGSGETREEAISDAYVSLSMLVEELEILEAGVAGEAAVRESLAAEEAGA